MAPNDYVNSHLVPQMRHCYFMCGCPCSGNVVFAS